MKDDLTNLGLNRFLVKDPQVIQKFSNEKTDEAVLRVADSKSPVNSGATTFDVTQTTDFLRDKTLKDCIIYSQLGISGTILNSSSKETSSLPAGYILGNVTSNGRGILISTDDGVSFLNVYESTGARFALLQSGNVILTLDGLAGLTTLDGGGLTISAGDLTISSGKLSVSGGFFNLPQLTTTQANALTPQNGSMYYDTTTNLGKIRINGAWKTITTA